MENTLKYVGEYGCPYSTMLFLSINNISESASSSAKEQWWEEHPNKGILVLNTSLKIYSKIHWCFIIKMQFPQTLDSAEKCNIFIL